MSGYSPTPTNRVFLRWHDLVPTPSANELFSMIWHHRDVLMDSCGGVLVAVMERERTLRYCRLMPDANSSRHLVLGAARTCDLQIRNSSVERKHALLSCWQSGVTTFTRIIALSRELTVTLQSGRAVSSSLFGEEAFVHLGDASLLAVPVSALSRGRPGPSLATEVRHPLRCTGRRRPPEFTPRVRRAERSTATSRRPVGVLHFTDGSCLVVDGPTLDRGLVLGRGSQDGGTVEVPGSTPATSRTQLALVRDPTGIWAVDLASTNGTRFGGVRARNSRLAGPLSFELGPGTGVRWAPATPPTISANPLLPCWDGFAPVGSDV